MPPSFHSTSLPSSPVLSRGNGSSVEPAEDMKLLYGFECEGVDSASSNSSVSRSGRRTRGHGNNRIVRKTESGSNNNNNNNNNNNSSKTDVDPSSAPSNNETPLMNGSVSLENLMASVVVSDDLEHEDDEAPQKEIRYNINDDCFDDMMRPSSPFVVLTYGERGRDLTTNGYVETAVIEMETELEKVEKEIKELREAEEKRREELCKLWKQKKSKETAMTTMTAGSSSTGCLGRGKNKKRNSISNQGGNINNNNNGTSCGRRTVSTVSVENGEKREHNDFDDSENEAELDQAEKSNASVEGTEISSFHTLREGNNNNITTTLLTSGSRTSLCDSNSEPGRRRGKGKQRRKRDAVRAVAADVTTSVVNDVCCRNKEESDDDMTAPFTSLRLMEIGKGGVLEFVFDEDDAEKRRVFREEEANLILKEHRIRLQMDAMRFSRAKYGKHYWQSNESVNSCSHCARPFSLTVRKHHCRRCGIILCNDCCSQVGRDMYAAQPPRVGDNNNDKNEDEGDYEFHLAEDHREEEGATNDDKNNTAVTRNDNKWFFDTCELTDGIGSRCEGEVWVGGNKFPKGSTHADTSSSSHYSYYNNISRSNNAKKKGSGRGGLKVRAAPWCRICNSCYLICLRARNDKKNFSAVLSDGRRCFHVLRDDEQTFTNPNMAWEARVAQLDVLRHFIVERATSAAQGQVQHVATLLREWMSSLGTRIEGGGGAESNNNNKRDHVESDDE